MFGFVADEAKEVKEQTFISDDDGLALPDDFVGEGCFGPVENDEVNLFMEEFF